jgi:hypothetical protein
VERHLVLVQVERLGPAPQLLEEAPLRVAVVGWSDGATVMQASRAPGRRRATARSPGGASTASRRRPSRFGTATSTIGTSSICRDGIVLGSYCRPAARSQRRSCLVPGRAAQAPAARRDRHLAGFSRSNARCFADG